MTMMDLLGPVKDNFKTKPFTKDSTLFWFFYRLTFALHVAFALMLGGKAYFGDPIDCAMRKSNALQGGIIDNYCWVTGTWTVKDKPEDQILPEHMSSRRKVWNIHPYVGLYDERFHEKVHHKYYQWVPFMLGLNAMLFYLPKFIWNRCEKANMATICEEIDKEGKNMSRSIIDNDITIKRITKVLKYYMRGSWHKAYTLNLILCECLNGLIVVLVWILTDYFLDYRFRTFGGDYHKFWVGWTNTGFIEPRNNIEDYGGPLDEAFPKVTKCTFHSFGYSGTQQKHDGLCVLMLNIVNEKCYLILWYWYVLAGIVSLIIVIKHALWFLVPDCVAYALLPKIRISRGTQNNIFRKLRVNHTPWNLFVLRQISNNIDAATWELLLAVFSREELPVPEKNYKHERGISYATIEERVSRAVRAELQEEVEKNKLEDELKKSNEEKRRHDDDKKKFHQSSNSYERLPKPKFTTLDRHSSSSDYGTMKANKGDHMRINMTLPSKRKPGGTVLSPSERNGHDGPYAMLSGSNRSLDSSPGETTDFDLGDNFVDASEMYNPVENQKNYDVTLRRSDDNREQYEKKKEY